MTWNRDYLPAIGLGISQIMGYGVLYYAYAILLPKMADPLGLTLSGIFGGWISFAAMTAILGVAILFSFFIPDAHKAQRSPVHDPA